ncbi:hypothetical protein I302_106274 [Kwoniella bestiolae CBS 10118]|uniref:protein-tyrosine-phosphatase n=1 Tax=Kwoniella bestiolae CBS 10118 TaxID=1296100 RepID=A0A1B9G3L2_9TREE|nr:hypothetical protein I302_05398 [Kwoniella bestiolae CBS 10118]OCF25578.1 hypothetical protein I302_05398 [Kwoniella bestiolae CBS 10118]
MEVEPTYNRSGDGKGYRSNGHGYGEQHENNDTEEDRWSKGSAPTTSSSITPPSSAFEFTFPAIHSKSKTTPDRRRQAPPTNIPNFPSAHEHRNPPPPVPFSPSPTQSPMASSPFRSPDPTPAGPSGRTPAFNLPLSQPFATSSGSGVNSPWHSLAATSGAPTPSLEGGPMGRGSPHLGYPFERLNIGGSWSGANLWGEGAQDRRGSADSTGGGPGSSPGRAPMQLSSPPPMNLPPPGPARGLSNETLLRYKAMASTGSTPMTKGASQGESGPSSRASSHEPTAPSPLPPALARRRGSVPKNSHAVPSLSLPPSRGGKSPSPLASSSTTSSPGAGGKRLHPINARSLLPLLSSPSTLILDVRPPSSFQQSHIPSSHSLPIPSTLLRRPAFNLDKLVQMLPPYTSEAVLGWREKADIVLVDGDSAAVSDGSVLDGLSSKFEREGYTGHMWFVKGGHAALTTHGEVRLVAQDEADEAPAQGSSTIAATNAAVNKGLMAGTLGTLAFRQESTGGRKGRAPPPTGLSIPPAPGFSFKANPFGISMPPSQSSAATERPGSSAGGRDLTLSAFPSPKKAKFQPANPFFDNIRQNLELSHGGITERIPLNLPDQVMSRVEELPQFLRNLATMPEKESMDQLANQFYDLELNEQKRLQTVMEWHSKGSGMALGAEAGKESWAEKRHNDAQEVSRLTNWNGEEATLQDDYFPFSITAGVERGTKNRYKNIWPYDFSRVRLERPPDEDSDYINASYVQPRGTSRRYIATQGPLDATYHDFWTLVWEQGVRVIVMITKQFEGGLIKCGNYWGDKTYGSLHLHVVSQTGGEDQAHQPTTGFDFGPAAVTPRSSSFPTGKERNIKRIFRLTNSDQPEEPPRTIVQIQCIGWPDFDVPETPETLFNLIKDVDGAVEESETTGYEDRCDQPPVLVHCSAGVGRTGSFIVVDAILDGLRRELRARRGSSGTLNTADRDIERSSSLPSRTAAFTFGSSDSGHKSGSLDSGKAVSFLSPPVSGVSSSGDLVPPILTSSPSPLATTVTMPTPPSRPLTAAALAANLSNQPTEEKMDVDVTEEPQGPPRDEKFFQHRGSVSTYLSSEAGGDTRRPSLASTKHSSDMLPPDAMSKNANTQNSNAPMPIIRSDTRNRNPSPVSEMANPIASVLEGMRVQRMSLVQSLRQYLFVHRAIIHNYLHILDEENESNRNSRPPLINTAKSNSTAGSTGTIPSVGTDDDIESHVKRRASPTELEIEPALTSAGMSGKPLTRTLGEIDSTTSSGLSKRPSFKKMRQAVDPIISPGSDSTTTTTSSTYISGGSSTSSITAGSSPLSPKKSGRLRSRSKLGLEPDSTIASVGAGGGSPLSFIPGQKRE